MRWRAPALVAFSAALLAFPAVAVADDGGSGTYSGMGVEHAVDVVNSGSTAWNAFAVIPPVATSITGCQITSGANAPCLIAQLQAGGEAVFVDNIPGGVSPGGHVLLTFTTPSPFACGARLELHIRTTGQGFTRVGDITFAGSCGTTPPKCSPGEIEKRTAALARARATLTAIEGELAAMPRKIENAKGQVDIARSEIARLLQEGLGTVLELNVAQAKTYLEQQRATLTRLENEQAALEKKKATAEVDVDRAKAALGECGVTVPEFRLARDDRSACGDQQAELASISARFAEHRRFVGSLTRAKVAAAAKRLDRLAAGLTRALPRLHSSTKTRAAIPLVRRLIAHLRAPRAVFRTATTVLHRFEAQVAKDRVAATAAQKALAGCQP
jgi:hypothetical protein